MRRISQISDLHFGATDPDVVAGLVAELNEDRPDLIVVSGDLTMGARRSEYARARAFLARLTSPWIAVPGNHDISPYHLWQRFTRPFARFQHFIAAETEPVWCDAEVGIVCLNTVRTWAPERNWSHGRIQPQQIASAEARFKAMPPHLFKIVVGHHPFVAPPWDEEARIVGRGDLALEAFSRCGVGLALAGHLHRHYVRFATPNRREMLDHPAAMSTSACDLLVVQAGSATSTRLRGGDANAYNRIHIDQSRATVSVRLWSGRGWTDATGLVVGDLAPDRLR